MSTVELRETVRDWVGSAPDDAAVDATVTAFDGQTFQAERAALRILRRRLADMEAAKWGVDGDYNEDTTANMKLLAGTIGVLARICGDPSAALPALQQAPITGPGSPR